MPCLALMAAAPAQAGSYREHRVADPRVIRLIGKWIDAGVLNNGRLMSVGRYAPGFGANATNNRANWRLKWGLRISRECLAPWSRSCSRVDVDLVLETVAPAAMHISNGRPLKDPYHDVMARI